VPFQEIAGFLAKRCWFLSHG